MIGKEFDSGAEAWLYKTNYLGKKVIVKERKPKKYRNKLLDEKITSARLKEEVIMLHKAKEAGVRTPIVYNVDKTNKAIYMEFIEGKQVKKVIASETTLCKEIGKTIGLLHKNNLIHGDLTTSNIILSDNKLVFLDFGLAFGSEKLEDKAVDLLGFKRTFNASHSKIKKGWEKIVDSYLKTYPKKAVLKQLEEVEARARYL